MAIVRIDQNPAQVAMLLNRGDDLTPWTATFKGLNLSTADGYTWFSRILANGIVVKVLTVTAVLSGLDTVVTVSGLSSAESTALASSGLTYDLGVSIPFKRTYIEGMVTCD